MEFRWSGWLLSAWENRVGKCDFLGGYGHVVECVHSEGRGEDVQGGTVFGMGWWLESFGEDVGGVVCGGYSPDSHSGLHVILLISWWRMSIDRECSEWLGWVAICSAAWLSV
jgi:hypothetical protein